MDTKIYFKDKEIGLDEFHKLLSSYPRYVYTIYTSEGKTVQVSHLPTIKLDYFLHPSHPDGVKVNMDIWLKDGTYVGITKIEIEEIERDK